MRKFLSRRIRQFIKDKRGVQGIEFAMIAPFFMISTLVAGDIGLAANQRMVIDHSIRASAQYLMQNESDVNVLETKAQEAADITTYSIESTYQGTSIKKATDLKVEVVKTCFCVDVEQENSCNALCPSQEAPSIYFDYTAWQTYDALFLPDFDISVTQRFQTR